MPLNIRLATQADKPAINELRKQVKLVHAAGRPDFFSEGFDEASADYLNVMMMQENAELFVADRDGAIVGFAFLEYIDRPATPYRIATQYCHIAEFGVDERYRRQGIGTALFDRVKACAAEKGYRRMELGMWEFNESALRFYESVGFHTYKRNLEYP